MKTVGEVLTSERKKQNVTLEEVTRKTKIPLATLEALEQDDYSSLPQPPFVKGFIRNYAQELGLDPEKVLAIFRRDHQLEKDKLTTGGIKAPLEEGFSWTPKTTVILFSVLILTTLAGFLFLQVKSYLFSPDLTILSPKQGERIKSDSVKVTGKTIPDATVYINDQLATLEFDGNFSYNLKLISGENLITVKALNRRGQEKEVKIEVVVDKN
jgi:cytoskeletal protein RodZ